jgi:hypothetical protein
MKVDQSLGFTVNLGDYNNAKIEVAIRDIDTEEDLDEQMAKAKKAINKAWPLVLSAADAEVAKIRGLANG